MLGILLLLLLLGLNSCTHKVQTAAPGPAAPLANASSFNPLPADDPLRGDVQPVHDPNLTQAQDGGWISWTTDLPFLNAAPKLAQRCSTDLLNWRGCGYVFPGLPAWVRARYPTAVGLWAPEIAFFGGQYHLYYSVSELGSQHSAIGMATSPTLDAADPRFSWTDHGPILTSEAGYDFNAIDPGLLIEAQGEDGKPHVWLSYGSYWGGIFQQELDPRTGLPGGPRYHLAQQAPNQEGALEGASMAKHNGWYYLFASTGYCCEIPIEKDTYRQIVGRSRSVHGPFTAEDGGKLLKGGGTVLLTSDGNWLAPGGGSVWQSIDGSQTLLAFHALRRAENGALYLWVERVSWKDDWPVLGPL